MVNEYSDVISRRAGWRLTGSQVAEQVLHLTYILPDVTE
jgi:hypothetical protein